MKDNQRRELLDFGYPQDEIKDLTELETERLIRLLRNRKALIKGGGKPSRLKHKKSKPPRPKKQISEVEAELAAVMALRWTTYAAPGGQKQWYRLYLKTAYWQRLRMKILGRAEYKCQQCSSKDGLSVHHKSYQRLGHEENGDLICLCIKCHNAEHGIEGKSEMIQIALGKQI